MIRPIIHVTRHLVFWSLLTVAVSLTGLRLLLMGVETYKSHLATYVSTLVGAPVAIGELRAKMRGFKPEVVLSDITVDSQEAKPSTAVALREVRVGLDLLAMLVNREVLPSTWVTLVGAKFSVYRKPDGSFAILGLREGDEQPNWLWQGRKFEILQSEIVWHGHPNKQHPLKLEAVDLAVINQGQHHRINLLAKLPDYYGYALVAAVDVTGNPFVAGSMDGKAFLSAKRLKLGSHFINDWVNTDDIAINDGTADLRLKATLHHSQLTAVSAGLGVQNALLKRSQRDDFSLLKLQAAVAWQMDPKTQQWQLDVPRFFAQTAQGEKSNLQFSLTGQQSEQGDLQTVALSVKQFDLQQASRTLQFFAPASETFQALITSHPTGNIANLSVFANLKDRTGAIQGDFNQISFGSIQLEQQKAAFPGLENFSAHIKGTHQHGVVQLSTTNARLKYSAFFRDDLIVNKLQGQLAWQQQTGHLAFTTSDLAIDVVGLQTLSRVQFLLPTQGAPFLDLQMAFACDDASQLKRYYPAKVMKPTDVIWLDNAFVAGRIHHGKLVYISKLGEPLATPIVDIAESTPLPNPAAAQAINYVDAGELLAREPVGGGLLEAQMAVEGLQLHYAPTWPELSQTSGELRFLQGRMEVAGDAGYSYQLKANHVKVVNPAIGKSKELFVQGQVDGKISDALAFLKNSPLKDRIGSVADAITTHGDTHVNLDLVLPLLDGGIAKVNGDASLNQAKLTVKSLDLPVTQVTGVLRFDEHGIYSDTIHAEALQEPVQIKLTSANGQATLLANGHAALSELERQFALPHLAVAEGGLDYQLAFRLPVDHQPSDLLIESNLVGVRLALPGPLAKSVGEQRPLKLVFSLNGEQLMPISVNYADQLKAALQFHTAQQRLVAGHILYGAGQASSPQQTGFKLDIKPASLDLKDAATWLAGSQTQSGGGPPINAVTLHTEQAMWGDIPLGSFDLSLAPKDGKRWSGKISSAFAVGDVSLPGELNADNTIRLDMSLLDLSIAKQFRHAGSNSESPQMPSVLSPQSVPLIEMNSRKTVWQALDLGALTLKTTRIPEGMVIKTLQLEGVAQQLYVSGQWTQLGKQTKTDFQGRLDMPDVGKTLARLGVSRDFADTTVAMQFTGHWPGAPWQFALDKLRSDVNLHFSEGRILSIEPGVGRILGFLAMEQWLKRLQLDFRDLYEEGLAFNSIKGRFKITDGKAVTRDLLVDAIPARITMNGNTDMLNKTLDLQVNVIPKSADALPIAGTIMDRFTALVARTLTGDEQEGFLLGSQYQLKGHWDSVQAIPLHDNDGLLPKLWNRLTGFASPNP
jgi:uncharacterized protein YhdP